MPKRKTREELPRASKRLRSGTYSTATSSTSTRPASPPAPRTGSGAETPPVTPQAAASHSLRPAATVLLASPDAAADGEHAARGSMQRRASSALSAALSAKLLAAVEHAATPSKGLISPSPRALSLRAASSLDEAHATKLSFGGRHASTAFEDPERATVDDIPFEVWLLIFSMLSDTDRTALSLTCVRFKAIFVECVGLCTVVLATIGTYRRKTLREREGIRYEDVGLLDMEPTDHTCPLKGLFVDYYAAGSSDSDDYIRVYHPRDTLYDCRSYTSYAFLRIEVRKSSARMQLYDLTLNILLDAGRFGQCVDSYPAVLQRQPSSLCHAAHALCRVHHAPILRNLYWNRGVDNGHIPRPQPRSVSIPLKPYQLRAVGWMEKLERRIASDYDYEMSFFSAVPCCKLGFDVRTRQFVANENDASKVIVGMRGGVLADEMGLGKTATVIGLIACRLKIPGSKLLHRAPKQHELAATLVLVPNQLVAQWKNEVKKFAPSLRVTMWRGLADMKKTSYEQLKDFDVIVASHQLLSNKNIAQAPVDIDEMGFYRVVVDEAHELLCGPKKGRFRIDPFSIASCIRWYVSGTPFPHESQSIRVALRYLMAKAEPSNDSPVSIDTLSLAVFMKQAKHFWYWRNVKASVADEVSIPSVVEDVQLIGFSAIERDLYDVYHRTHDRALLREWCTTPFTSRIYSYLSIAERTMGDDVVRPAAIEKFKKELARAEREVVRLQVNAEDCKRSIAAAEAELERIRAAGGDASPTTKSRVPKLRGSLRQKEAAIARAELDVVECARKLTCVERTCVERSTDSRIAFGVSEAAVRKFGSKLAALGGYIRAVLEEDADAKVIVFTKFQEMLNMFREALLEGDLFEKSQVVSCRGNFAMRAKAISSFNKSNARKGSACVMILSHENAASGTHLAVASHIILMDPLHGTREEVKAQDAQAIARAHRIGQEKPVTVVRLLIENTVDQKDYEATYGVVL